LNVRHLVFGIGQAFPGTVCSPRYTARWVVLQAMGLKNWPMETPNQHARGAGSIVEKEGSRTAFQQQHRQYRLTLGVPGRHFSASSTRDALAKRHRRASNTSLFKECIQDTIFRSIGGRSSKNIEMSEMQGCNLPKGSEYDVGTEYRMFTVCRADETRRRCVQSLEGYRPFSNLFATCV
jgi:hypothetical protein